MERLGSWLWSGLVTVFLSATGHSTKIVRRSSTWTNFRRSVDHLTLEALPFGGPYLIFYTHDLDKTNKTRQDKRSFHGRTEG